MTLSLTFVTSGLIDCAAVPSCPMEVLVTYALLLLLLLFLLCLAKICMNEESCSTFYR